jgi:hypothetical protein
MAECKSAAGQPGRGTAQAKALPQALQEMGEVKGNKPVPGASAVSVLSNLGGGVGETLTLDADSLSNECPSDNTPGPRCSASPPSTPAAEAEPLRGESHHALPWPRTGETSVS